MYKLKYGESPNTNTDALSINMILQPFYSLDFKNRYVRADVINQNYSKYTPKINLLGEMYQIWNSQLLYYVNTSGFITMNVVT